MSVIVIEPGEGQQAANGRRYAFPLASTAIFLTAANGSVALLLLLFLQQHGFAPIVISSISSVNAAGAMLGSLFWGRLSDSGARRVLLFITALGAALSIGVLLVLPPASVILASSFAGTFMRMGFMTITIAIVSGASVMSRRGKNLSFVTSAQALGMCAGSASAGFMLEYLGFRGGFAVAMVLALAGTAFLLLLPREHVPVVRSKQSSWSLAFSAGLADLYISTILRQMAIHGAFSLLAVYMASVGIPPRYIGIVAAMNTGTQVVALLVFGRLADRIGRRRIFMLGFALSALTPCVFALSSHIAAMMAGYVTLGLGFSSLYIG
ncbi:MFS transporter, partial [Candidatus Bipolaricaulota bacterium]|nr:MFS transporter [Candidatus Bipolaricaulota bacterium]